MAEKKDHLSVCVCTYKRPEMLGHLLDTLNQQETQDGFIYSILVVDNDKEESARETVARAREKSPVTIEYHVEPIQNISLARNRAIRGAEGDFIACIDDDETADRKWVFSLIQAIKAHAADGILGPVFPSFVETAPSWVLRGKLFERESCPSGTEIKNAKQTRSGNFMIVRKIVKENEDLFRPEFGLTGGEDVDFFGRMLGKGYRFYWCQEAKVNETIPPSRVTRTYLLKRAMMRGVTAAKRGRLASLDTLRSIGAVLFYTSALPFLFLAAHHLFMRCLIRDCDHLAKILARFGIKLMHRWPT